MKIQKKREGELELEAVERERREQQREVEEDFSLGLSSSLFRITDRPPVGETKPGVVCAAVAVAAGHLF